MTLYTELKRRNVFRIAAAYVVIGWLILQLADIILGFIEAPSWAGQALIALLLLGFVPVLALAWVFEVGPHGVRVDDGSGDRDGGPQSRRLDVITLGAVVLVMILAVWQHLGPALKGETVPPAKPDRAKPAESGHAAPPVAIRVPPGEPFEIRPGSIAVLPFTNRSAEPDTAYFVDGIHDDLLTELSRNPALTVISRTSVMEYRDTTKNLRQIGEELAVAHILEGAVQRAGRRVRINAQLIDADTDAHLWAETFDRELTPESVFEVQTEIATAIAQALGRALGVDAAAPAAMSAPTANPKAYDLYLRARSLSSTASESHISRTIDLYREALAEDPAFALAMGELGLELTNLYWFVTRRDTDRDEARQWIDRALAIDPEQPRLRWILARHLYHGELDYEGALAQLALAEQGMPGSAEVFGLRSWIARRAGRIDEFFEAATTAAMLDPRSPDILGSLCETHVWLGDLEAAKPWSERLALVPGAESDYRICLASGRLWVLGDTEAFVRGLAEHPFEPGSGFARDILLLSYWQRDFPATRRAIADYPLDPLEDQFYLLPKSLLQARVAHAAGDAGAAVRAAARALAELDAVLAEHPGDYRAMSARALALGLLGRGDEARDWADRALSQPPAAKDVVLRSALMADRLQMLALVVDSEALAREMERYLGRRLKVAYFDGLMLDPLFDRHREHPAFRALAAKHSRREAGP